MSLLLVIEGWVPEIWEERFKRLAPERGARLWRGETEGLEDVRYAVVWRPPRGFLTTLPKLEAIFNLGAGADAVLKDPDMPAVPLVRMANPNLTLRMTEYVVLHVLLHHRRMLDYGVQQASRVWRELRQPSADQVRVGIMGMGVLGADAAKALMGLGFQVAGWSRERKSLAGVESFAGPEELDAFLKRTDVLVCLLPLTAETEGVLNYDLFSRLARDGASDGPVLINAGRGGHQIEADVLKALDDGTLRAASLDVFVEEPLPPTSPLWTHPRLVLTPHVAAESDPEHLARAVLRQIERLEAGKGLENVVDRGRGY